MLKSLFFVLALTASTNASAQLLPGVGGGVGNTVSSSLGTARDTLQSTTDTVTGTLRGLRQTAARDLVRRNRAVIDTDPAGEPVIRNEVVAIAPTDAALSAARARGFTVGETVDARELGLSVVVLRAPQGLSTRRALALLQQIDPQGAYDYNHIYLPSGEQHATPAQVAQTQAGSSNGARVGLIDSGVDASHAAFHGIAVEQRAFTGARAIADTHGTEVASLMVGADGAFHGAAPGASLFVADVYGGLPTGGGATAIVAAIAWLAQQHVPVINISLVGPSNRVLEAGVRAAVARGFVIVAAVGNDGPSAPPLYPASYPGVIGVTGVDAHNRVLPEAGRGRQVSFAAPGSDMAAAAPGGRYVSVRGTSYAAPIVAGLIAREMRAPDAQGAARAEASLARAAFDLGARGTDTTYGQGFVGAEVRNAPQLVARR